MSAPPTTSSPSSRSNSELLYSDPYLRVELAYRGALIRIVRTALVHPDLSTLRDSFLAAVAAIDHTGRRGRVLLFDSRAPIGRNDPAFETEMSALRPRIDHTFTRVAVLVRSAVGVLQMKRLAGEDGTERAIGNDEAAMLEFLKINIA